MYTINSKVFQLSTISTDSSIIKADNNDTEIEKCLYCHSNIFNVILH